MNYIERVLPSLGEDSVTLRPDRRGGRRCARAGRDPDRRRRGRNGQGQPPDGAGPAEAGEPADARSRPARGAGVSVKGEVLSLSPSQLTRIRNGVLAHHRLNKGRGPAEDAVLTALAAQVPEELGLDEEVIPGTDHRLGGPTRCSCTPGGRTSTRPKCWPGSGTRGWWHRSPTACWTRSEQAAPRCILRPRGLVGRRHRAARRTGRDPRAHRGRRGRGTADLPARRHRDDRGRDHGGPAQPRPGGRPGRGAARHVRARARRRGPGPLSDAVADAPQAGHPGQLDTRRRPRRRARGPTWRRSAKAMAEGRRLRAAPDVPALHELPQPGRGVRPRSGRGAQGVPAGRPARRRPLDRCRSAAAHGARARACRPAQRRTRRPLRAGGGHDRRDRAPRPGWTRWSRPTCPPSGLPRDGSASSPHWTPRAWSTTALSSSLPTRSSPSRPAASGCSTSRSPVPPSGW